MDSTIWVKLFYHYHSAVPPFLLNKTIEQKLTYFCCYTCVSAIHHFSICNCLPTFLPDFFVHAHVHKKCGMLKWCKSCKKMVNVVLIIKMGIFACVLVYVMQ